MASYANKHKEKSLAQSDTITLYVNNLIIRRFFFYEWEKERKRSSGFLLNPTRFQMQRQDK